MGQIYIARCPRDKCPHNPGWYVRKHIGHTIGYCGECCNKEEIEEAKVETPHRREEENDND